MWNWRKSLLIAPNSVPRLTHSADQSHIVVQNTYQYQNLGVSPEFVLRPLLSERLGDHRLNRLQRVSPEFVLRPLLSGVRRSWQSRPRSRVAGVCAPAIVERPCAWRSTVPGRPVSPEFVLRPLLSG